MVQVHTVTGDIPAADLGICLVHEHVLNDVTSWWHEPFHPRQERLAHEPLAMDQLWELRQDPFASRDNCRLDDVELAIREVGMFAELGGSTILEATSASIGRNPQGLRQVSMSTGVRIVMGAGLYLDSSMPSEVDELTVEDIAEGILADINDGVDGIHSGFIGEIGVSAEFTDRERKSLEGACVAQRESGLPMQVHLPGWFRLGHDVLDLVEGVGADVSSTVLCHMNPSGHDVEYQESLLTRGAWLQYDMVGMEVFYADQSAQSPSDEENARHLSRLIDRGWKSRLLISSDIFLKSLLRTFGGPGYGHVIEFFLPRMQRHGVDPETAMALVTDNPRQLFEGAQRDSEENS